jgi:membrane-bound lytic murein transglycosylase A
METLAKFTGIRYAATLILVLLLAACATTEGKPRGMQQAVPDAHATCPPPQPCPACPLCPTVEPAKPPERPLQRARWEAVRGWEADDLGEALGALLESCNAMAKLAAWRGICEEARGLGGPGAGRASDGALRGFIESRFTPWQVVNPDGSREGLVTGYYEPLVRGNRNRTKRYPHPVYGVPDDLLVIDLADVYPELKNLRLRGRLDGRKVVPYWSRTDLAQKEVELAGRALLWVDDPIELFFLQVQGSGRVELPDGSRVRVGFAEQNGHPYQSIGRWLVERGELKLEQASMQGIKSWAKANPKRLPELLNANPSFVFFRELADNGGGPYGALGVPLTPGRSIAVDPRAIPLGAPVFLATTLPNSEKPLLRLMLAQDTGGAIKGAVRADFFWGLGTDAGAQAGRMRQKGEMWVLLPNGHAPP